MAITQKLCNNLLTANDHAFVASGDVAVTTIHLCNVTQQDATVNIYVLISDGSTYTPSVNNKLYSNLTVRGNDTYIIDSEKLILAIGDKIYIETPDSSGLIVATISTIGL
jgi:hypothetical protein